jgi:hypothetical protein
VEPDLEDGRRLIEEEQRDFAWYTSEKIPAAHSLGAAILVST